MVLKAFSDASNSNRCSTVTPEPIAEISERNPKHLRIVLRAELKTVAQGLSKSLSESNEQRTWGLLRDELAVADWLLEQAQRTPRHTADLLTEAVACLTCVQVKIEELKKATVQTDLVAENKAENVESGASCYDWYLG